MKDIATPRCFEIAAQLSSRLDTSLLHDDPHGTAVVILRGLMNKAKGVQKYLKSRPGGVAGIAAAGTATPNLLLHLGLHNSIGDDRDRAIVRGRAYPRRVLRGQAAVRTQPDNRSGSFRDLLTDADGFIGVSTGNLVRQEDWAVTAPGAIAFLMAHPPPEVALQPACPLVLVVATRRSDDPNQVNNLPGIPGLFRGVLNCRGRTMTMGMKVTAPKGLASVVEANEICPASIIPGVFYHRVAERVTRAAASEGFARRVPSEPFEARPGAVH